MYKNIESLINLKLIYLLSVIIYSFKKIIFPLEMSKIKVLLKGGKKKKIPIK